MPKGVYKRIGYNQKNIDAMRLAKIGSKCTNETKQKMSLARLGWTPSLETRIKMSNSQKKKGIPKEQREKMVRKLIEKNSGKNHWRWIADRSLLKKNNGSEEDRRSSAYVTWRKNIWTRDKYKCRIANEDCKGKIEAHHILSWREYPELRYQDNNGITLCHAHHPRKREEEKRLISYFMELVSVSKADD
jgi:hypothetical protein